MSTAIRGIVLGLCAVAIAQVAAAAGPTVKVAKSEKNHRMVEVTVTSPDDQLTYNCVYAWDVEYTNLDTSTDNCEFTVAPGTKNFVVCSRKYDKLLSDVRITQARCTPA